MFIKDLQARQTNVEVEGEVLELGDVREFNKFGKQGRVANAIIKDDTGKVKLSLWNEQIDSVKKGDKVKILKGYVGEFQGELQLTTGKFGTLEILSGETASETEPAATPTPEPETAPEPEPTPAPEPVTPAPTEPPKEEKKEDAPHENLDVEEEDLT